jgi:thiamine-monophosphate kinase
MNPPSKDDRGESFVIGALTGKQPLPSWVRTGPGDDAAILEDGQVLTTDLMVQGVHFDEAIPPESLAWKLVAVNASDVAACGARPTWALLSIALPEPLDRDWVDRFSQAFVSRLTELNIALIGGDTTRSSGPILLNLAMAGQLVRKPLLRSTAGPDEDLWVSGFLGDASGGFHLKTPALRAHFERPDPPLALGPALAEQSLATAAMDLSDGLLQDLRRLCTASNCGADVDPALLPASAELKQATSEILVHQVAFGEDYQLLFTAKEHHRSAIQAVGDSLGLRLTRIGRTSSFPGIRIPGCETLVDWSHFQERER